MTKSELVNVVAEANPELGRRHVEMVVNTIFDSMRDALLGGDRIEIRGFGSFTVRVRRPRMGRNPKTGVTVNIGEKKVPFFKVGKELRERVNDGLDPGPDFDEV